MEAEPTISDVLKEFRAQGSRTDSRFEDIITSVADLAEAVNAGFSGVQTQIEGLKTDVSGLTQRVTRIEATMVTKDYLDEKLGKTDGKINALVNVLERKSVITTDEKSAVLV